MFRPFHWLGELVGCAFGCLFWVLLLTLAAAVWLGYATGQPRLAGTGLTLAAILLGLWILGTIFGRPRS